MDYYEKISRLSNERLIDVVKNHKQYGYPDEIRDHALKVLDERGYSVDHLRLTGNLENHERKVAGLALQSAVSSNRYTLLAWVATWIVLGYFGDTTVGLIVGFILLIVYIGLIINTLNEIEEVLRATGREDRIASTRRNMFIGGLFLYPIVFFVVQASLKEAVDKHI